MDLVTLPLLIFHPETQLLVKTRGRGNPGKYPGVGECVCMCTNSGVSFCLLLPSLRQGLLFTVV